ncbi:Methyltransferase type 11 [Niveomyces insectorum RCEF 264]|uniref:Methyltransferase type 11 n=1 Tax=Niveomyces insectorum RCEF 264 TaxID=1081102 RepID=A0A167RDH8_9HYPO|nr:Methyltransferase type 11 [Niveomyces insectorum RCEF 264]
MATSQDIYQKLIRDTVGSAGDAEEKQMIDSATAVAGPAAIKMLEVAGLDASTDTPFTLLDSACGSGVTAAVLNQTLKREVLEKSSILCTDVSESMVNLVKRRIANEGWISTTAEQRDAQKTELPDKSFTHITLGMALFLMADSIAAIKDCVRILKPGGRIAFTTFPESSGKAGWIPDARTAFASFPTEIPFSPPMRLDTPSRWFEESWVKKTLLDNGFQDVNTVLHSYTVSVDGPEHFMRQFGMMFEMVRNMQWSDELKKQYSKEDMLERVEAHLQEKYGGKGWDLTFTLIVGSGQISE